MEESLRTLVALAFTGLLVMLRLDAGRFGAAEYADADRYGEGLACPSSPGLVRRGVGVCAGDLAPVNLDRAGILYLRPGDRGPAILLGVLVTAGSGIAQAAAFAFRYHRHSLGPPVVASYPVAVLNSIGTALIDEAAFRGAILGYLILIGVPAGGAILLQAVAYGLVTRLGAPGRDRYMLVLSIVIGLASGYVTLRTGGIGAAFLGHAVARFATFVATGHAGQPAPLGREEEEIERKRRIPEGWSTVGTSRESVDR